VAVPVWHQSVSAVKGLINYKNVTKKSSNVRICVLETHIGVTDMHIT